LTPHSTQQLICRASQFTGDGADSTHFRVARERSNMSAGSDSDGARVWLVERTYFEDE
jgi:hypothetical protein